MVDEMKNTALVFVYGSLKKGFWNNRFLKGAAFLGEGHTSKLYTLVDGGVPFAVPNEKGLPVKGEVYEIDLSTHLGPLDWLEGHPRNYERTTVGVVVNGEMMDAFIYEMKHISLHSCEGRECKVEEDKYVWTGR